MKDDFSKRLGHATITQTLETYAHLMQDTDEKMMKIIENESNLSPKKHKKNRPRQHCRGLSKKEDHEILCASYKKLLSALHVS